MKFALAIFHFNPHWNCDSRSAHRHCTEAFAPFLNAVKDHSHWRVSVEMSGSGLEFVNQAYPHLMNLLRQLIEDGCIELISALYTPNIWVAFPHRDLLTSVRFNQRCLDELGLPRSRIFFAQEAFFGMGAARLSDAFDFAVCKDDYLTYQRSVAFVQPAFRLGRLPVLVASNHLLNELSKAVHDDPGIPARFGLCRSHLDHLEAATHLNNDANFPAARGRIGEIEWLWYHCGDGNHFGSIYKPDDLERCYYDATWSSLCVQQLESYRASGYRLSSLAEFAARLDFSTAQELSPIIEAGWNPRNARGVLCWMGSNNTASENDNGVLCSIGRARMRLVAAERAVAARGSSAEEVSKIEDTWKVLLHAQISDALGWRAGPQAVQYAITAAEQVMIAANQILGTAVAERQPLGPRALYQPCEFTEIGPGERVEHLPKAELFGVQGHGSYTSVSREIHIYECNARGIDSICGVSFPFESSEIVYCPSGMEDTPVRIRMDALELETIVLPLANGLLMIAEGQFLIKDTAYVHLAASVCPKRRSVTFAVEGSPPNKNYTWRFYLVQGTLGRAVEAANTINSV
jgi:hypothetical protein